MERTLERLDLAAKLVQQRVVEEPEQRLRSHAAVRCRRQAEST